MTATHETDPASRSMESWCATLAVLASREETTGPRVEEARRALSWHRVRRALDREVELGQIPRNRVDELLDRLAALP